MILRSVTRHDSLTWGCEKAEMYSTRSGHIEWMKHENRAFNSGGDQRWKWD